MSDPGILRVDKNFEKKINDGTEENE